jgi:hypothetical protein
VPRLCELIKCYALCGLSCNKCYAKLVFLNKDDVNVKYAIKVIVKNSSCVCVCACVLDCVYVIVGESARVLYFRSVLAARTGDSLKTCLQR